MNKGILAFFLCIYLFPVSGQDWHVNKIGESNKSDCWSFNRQCLQKGDYDKLKGAKLYFVLPEYLTDEVETYQEILSKAWEFNELTVISTEEYDVVKNDENTAFFMIRYSLYYIGSQMYVFRNVRLELTMQTKQNGKNDYNDATRYALIYMVPDAQTQYLSNENWREENMEIKIRTFNDHIINHAIFSNFKPNLMANYLRRISAHLKDHTAQPINRDKKELASLMKDTLYVTDNCLLSQIKYDAKKKKYITKQHKQKRIFRSYAYAYKLISFDELETKISDGEAFLYAMFDRNGAFTIFNSTSGESITESLTSGPTRQNLKFSFRKLTREIKRSNRRLKSA